MTLYMLAMDHESLNYHRLGYIGQFNLAWGIPISTRAQNFKGPLAGPKLFNQRKTWPRIMVIYHTCQIRRTLIQQIPRSSRERTTTDAA